MYIQDSDLPPRWTTVLLARDEAASLRDGLESIRPTMGIESAAPDRVLWEVIEDAETGVRAAIRLTMQIDGTTAVSGVCALPGAAHAALAATVLRGLPLAAIQNRINNREDVVSATLDATFASRGLADVPDRDRRYAALALEWLQLVAEGERRPTRELADRHGMPLSTVQRWLTRARERGYLPLTIRGESGRPSQKGK